MTEAMRDISRSAGAVGPASTPARAVNGAALRWTPGPDELRLPSCEDEDEHVPQNTRQAVEVEESFGSLRQRWRGRRDVFVGTDQFVYWDPAYDRRTNPDNPPLAPDVYVAFGVANRHRSSYVVWEEGKPPDFVLEVVSPSSRERDVEEKRDLYAKMGVPEYFLYDPEGRLEPPLSGFKLCGGKYEPLPQQASAKGVVGVGSTVLGLWLCIRPPGPEPLDGSLCWYDPVTGEFLPYRYELADDNRQLVADNRQLVADNRRAEARVAELTALVRKMQRD